MNALCLRSNNLLRNRPLGEGILTRCIKMSSGAEKPVTPDFNTSVDIESIKLSKPKKWKGLEGLKERSSGSLIPETLQQMEDDAAFQLTAAKLKEIGAKRMTLEEKKKRRRALDQLNLPTFKEYLEQHKLSIDRSPSTILQLNIGLYCNQACNHCHVESSPKRTESMSREVADRCLRLIESSPSVKTLDLTGGAPELNPQFRYLVEEGRKLGVEVIDRCNLTALQEPGQEDLAEFLAKNKVRVVASLPCYSAKNVNTQRGSGVFDRSILGLKNLNDLGYGIEGTGLSLDLVYNPLGAFLPPAQDKLEAKYKEELFHTFGISFSNLFTITNMPIKRFADFLHRRGELNEYMELLVRNFNPSALKGLMCKDTVSVGWDGRIFDCDFNQQMGMGMGTSNTNSRAPEHLKQKLEGYSVFDIETLDELRGTDILLESHCFGCTSGMGSSCQGVTA
mmetsp:Transcript_14164/g.20932  ORF Transcript_14164/g.20932 Transcript_14164/m.20932 type:complete len:450 (+) Transcript_14164:26-1375(+)